LCRIERSAWVPSLAFILVSVIESNEAGVLAVKGDWLINLYGLYIWCTASSITKGYHKDLYGVLARVSVDVRLTVKYPSELCLILDSKSEGTPSKIDESHRHDRRYWCWKVMVVSPLQQYG
jgi:hypothetical protein